MTPELLGIVREMQAKFRSDDPERPDDNDWDRGWIAARKRCAEELEVLATRIESMGAVGGDKCDGSCWRSDDGFCDEHHPSRTEPLPDSDFWKVAMFDRWRIRAKELGFDGIVEAIESIADSRTRQPATLGDAAGLDALAALRTSPGRGDFELLLRATDDANKKACAAGFNNVDEVVPFIWNKYDELRGYDQHE